MGLGRSRARASLPIGQDVCFAAPWRAQFGHVAGVLQAIDAAVAGHLRTAVDAEADLREGAARRKRLRLRFPIVQGPMTRVSDVAEFAVGRRRWRRLADGRVRPAEGRSAREPARRHPAAARRAPVGHRPARLRAAGAARRATRLRDRATSPTTRSSPAAARTRRCASRPAACRPSSTCPSANLIPLFIQRRRAALHLRGSRMRRPHRSAEQLRPVEHDGRSTARRDRGQQGPRRPRSS